MENNDCLEFKTFKTPFLQKAGDTLVSAFFLGLFPALIFGVSRSYVYLTLAGVIMAFFFLICRKFGIAAYWVIRLYDSGIQMGGRILPCCIAYEDISLLTLGSLGEKVTGISSPPPLTIAAGTKTVKIRLKAGEAEPCLNYIRKRASYAGGVDYSKLNYGSDIVKSIDKTVEFKPRIQSEKYQKAISRHAWSVIILGILLLIPMVLVFIPDSSGPRDTDVYAGALMSFAAGCFLIRKGISMQQKGTPDKKSGKNNSVPKPKKV